MGRPPGKEDSTRAPVSPEYIELVEARLRALKMSKEEFVRQLRRAGIGRSTVFRFFRGDATERVARAISDFVRLPPPYFAIRSEEEAEWHRLGRDLEMYAPEDFKQILAHLRVVVDATMKKRDAQDGIKVLARPDVIPR